MKFFYFFIVCFFSVCLSFSYAYKLLNTPNNNDNNDAILESTLMIKVSDKRDIINNPSDFLTHAVLVNSNLIYYFEKEVFKFLYSNVKIIRKTPKKYLDRCS